MSDIEDIEVGGYYRLSGDVESLFGLKNVNWQNVDCFVKIVTDKYVVCACGRRFIRNENFVGYKII